jgi:hypothetical protein
VLFRTAGKISDPRFSAGGDRIAFIHHPDPEESMGEVMLVNLRGETRTVSPRSSWAFGLTWAPGDSEVWYTVRRPRSQHILLAVRPDGRAREVYRSISPIQIYDLSADGSALLSTQLLRRDMVYLDSERGSPRVLSWADWSVPVGISRDGKVLFAEPSNASSEGGKALLAGPSNAGSEGEVQGTIAIVRNTDGTAPRILGEFIPIDISPDGRSALVASSPREWLVVPTGPGTGHRLDTQGLELMGDYASWLPDGKSFVAVARGAGDPGFRFYLVKEDGSSGRKVSDAPVGVPPLFFVSPDGKWLAARGPDLRPVLISLIDGKVESVPAIEGTPGPRGWAPDGSLWLQVDVDQPQPRGEMVRVDVRTGQVLQRQVLAPADGAGGMYVRLVHPAPDGRGFLFAYVRDLGSLYISRGLAPRAQ